MRRKTIRGAWLLAACMALAPAVAKGQSTGPDYAPADPQLPVPLGSTRPEDGGLFLTAEFTYFRWNNPLQNQPIAMRGFLVTDNSLASVGIPSGTFLGSGTPALNVNNLTGQDSYQPGFLVGGGWKFGDGSAVSFSYMRLTEASYRAAATGAAPDGLGSGSNSADSFLYAPVYNFPPQLAGAANKIFIPAFPLLAATGINPTPINSVSSQFAFGTWNGASIMSESYLMRFQQWDITYRKPVYETDDLH